MTQAEIDAGERPGTTTADAAHMAESEREGPYHDVLGAQLAAPAPAIAEQESDNLFVVTMLPRATVLRLRYGAGT